MCYMIGRLAYFAVIGLVAIVAVGPVVGVVGALLPFALIGLVAFAGYRGVQRLFGRRPVAIPPLPRPAEVAARDVVDALPAEPAEAPEVAAPPPARPRRGRVVVEMLCGAVVGGLVAAAVSWQAPELLGTVVPAVVAGAVVGYVVGGTNAERARPARALDA